MPEFKFKEGLVDKLSLYPGDKEVSGWLLENRLPISTEDEVSFVKQRAASALEMNLDFRNARALQGLWNGVVDDRIFKSASHMTEWVTRPIGQLFRKAVKEEGVFRTLPIQIRSWINGDGENGISCQLPLVFAKFAFDKASVANHVRIETDAQHPKLMIEGGGKYFVLDFMPGGDRVREINQETWDNKRLKEDWASLFTTLGTMRFIDYSTSMIKVYDKILEMKQGNSDRTKMMRIRGGLFEAMSDEFNNPELLERYFDMAYAKRVID